LALGIGASAAEAHPYLLQGSPAGGVVAQRAPRTIVLAFTEPVVAAGSSVHLVDPRGRAIPLARVARPTSRTLQAAIPRSLRPGVYEVRWVALGDDGHSVSGDFRFGVPKSNGAPPPDVARLGAPGTRGRQAAASEGVLAIIAAWLGIIAAGVLVAGPVLRRRAGEQLDPRWRTLRAVALGVLAASSLYALLRAATSDGDLLAQTDGRVALASLALTLTVGATLLARRLPDRRADLFVALAGAEALIGVALKGHVQTITDAPGAAILAQTAHVLAAGMWMGGLVLLALGVPRGVRAVRVFAPVAAVSVGVLAGTGALAAIEEVRNWYFLRWSSYGNVVLAKTALLLLVAPCAVAAWIALRRERRPVRVLRVETIGVLGIGILAVVLSGLVPGRDQLLPAQRGNLLTGAAFATGSTGAKAVALTVAPARPGMNLVAVTPLSLSRAGLPADARSVKVTLQCQCRPHGQPLGLQARLRRGAAGTWRARVGLPVAGTWLATPAVDGRAALAASTITVGDPPVRGTTPREVLMTADLTGPAALRCRATAAGVQLALGRFDARGGLPGGGKVALDVEDDGGDPARAAALVRAAHDHSPIALLAPCGSGAGGAIRADTRLPTLVADPSVPLVRRPRLWRTAGDPRAEGSAVGRFILEHAGTAVRGPREVAAVEARSDPGAEQPSNERLAGLQAALAPASVRLVDFSRRAAASAGVLRRAVDSRRYLATFVDGDWRSLAKGLNDVGARAADRTSPIFAASPLLDEDFQQAAGKIGLTGGITSPSEVVPNSADAQRYVSEVRALLPGERPSMPGLRGYVAGLALGYALANGDRPGDIGARLRRPRPFTNSLIGPWLDTGPTQGGPFFAFVAPVFLPSTLIPVRLGGEHHSGSFFDNGAWELKSGRVYGPQD
jgi:methionine-rich copper-binding protein CopC/putative copper export protein